MSVSTGNLLGDADSTRQLRELHEAMVVKTQTVAFSNVKTDDFQVIQRTSGLKLELADDPPCNASEKSIDAFGWDDRPEPAQCDRSGIIYHTGMDFRDFNSLIQKHKVAAILAIGNKSFPRSVGLPFPCVAHTRRSKDT